MGRRFHDFLLFESSVSCCEVHMTELCGVSKQWRGLHVLQQFVLLAVKHCAHKRPLDVRSCPCMKLHVVISTIHLMRMYVGMLVDLEICLIQLYIMSQVFVG